MLQIIPLFSLILLGYFGLHLIGFFPNYLYIAAFTLPLPSGEHWQPTYGDILIIVGLLALFMEVYKSTKTTDSSIFEHVLSTIVLMIFLVLWLIEPWAGNSYFAMLALMSLFDVAAGFTVSVAVARRDFQIGPG